MIRLIRFFKIAWALSRTGGAWAGDCEWEASDAESLRHFLSGTVGQRFTARLRNASISMNARAVLSSDPAGDGRKAAGYMLAIEEISGLAAPQVSEITEEEAYGAGIPLELIAP